MRSQEGKPIVATNISWIYAPGILVLEYTKGVTHMAISFGIGDQRFVWLPPIHQCIVS